MIDRKTNLIVQASDAERLSTNLGTRFERSTQAPEALFDDARRIGFSDEELMQLSHIYLNAFAFDRRNRSETGAL